jgi:hypothetical protein
MQIIKHWIIRKSGNATILAAFSPRSHLHVTERRGDNIFPIEESNPCSVVGWHRGQ